MPSIELDRQVGQDPENGCKISAGSGLLRNSTIFRCAKNSDSDSARRQPPEAADILSGTLIVLGILPHLPVPRELG